jgi:ketosteroid isomerase-like protein
MRVREYLGAVLFASTFVSHVHAQEPPPSLREAERAFADALARHDRAAFVAMFAPDAESSLPVEKHGPEAIASDWLPFLIDPGTTMLLETTEVTMGTSSDVGNTAGALAIRGRTNTGLQTIPLGTYSIAWRLVDGRWKISRLSGSTNGARTTTNAVNPTPASNATPNGANTTPASGGVGRYRFGMSRAEVSQVSDCPRYVNVAVTGGLECAPYVFEGQGINISFLFTADRLRRVQLWMYEGQSAEEAEQAVARVLVHLERIAGGVTVRSRPDMSVTPAAVMKMLSSAPPQANGIAQVEIVTASGTQPDVWFAKVGHHQYGYMVMLFADSRDGR